MYGGNIMYANSYAGSVSQFNQYEPDVAPHGWMSAGDSQFMLEYSYGFGSSGGSGVASIESIVGYSMNIF